MTFEILFKSTIVVDDKLLSVIRLQKDMCENEKQTTIICCQKFIF